MYIYICIYVYLNIYRVVALLGIPIIGELS